jgi:integrase
VTGPYGTRRQAEEELAAALARIGGGGYAPDRSLRVSAYLDGYLAGKVNLKPRSLATDAEAFRLYWKPALGHMRLADVRKRHVDEAIREMTRINRPDGDGKPPETLRRMLAARAPDERRELPPGGTRHPKSGRPLGPARVARMFAPFRAAMNAAVPAVLAVSPCAGVELPRARRVRPLAWTPAREEAFRAAYGGRLRAAGSLAAAGRQAIWASPGLRPCPVMVWLPEHAARFLGRIAGERLFALFSLTAYCGLRRDEVAGLAWAEVDLDEGIAYVRETGGGDGPKSESGVRVAWMPDRVTAALRAWRARQAAERLAWGPAWQDAGLVFTREDGTPVPGPWMSVRFAALAFRAGLPPVRFHDLRHGAASLRKAAGQDTKVISAMLGHSRTSFTDATYVLVFPEVAREAAEAAAAVVDARTLPARNGHHQPVKDREPS